MKLDPEVVELQLKTAKLISRIPPGTNPFEFFLNDMIRTTGTPVSKSNLVALKIFFFLHLLIFASCFTILGLHFIRDNRNRRWIVKKLYIADPYGDTSNRTAQKAHPVPLYFLNSGAIMAFSQLIGSFLSLIYIVLWNIGERAKREGLTFVLLGLIFEFEFLAYWVMIWGFLCTSLYSGTSYAMRLKTHPRLTISPLGLNLIFLIIPILATVLHIISNFSLVKALNYEAFIVSALFKSLKSLSKLWEISKTSGNKTDPSVFKTLLKGQLQLQELNSQLVISIQGIINNLRYVSAIWGLVLILTSLLLVFSLGNLLALSIRKSDQNVSILPKALPPGSSAEPRRAGILQFRYQKLMPKSNAKIRRNIYFLAFRGIMAFMANITTIAYFTRGLFHAANSTLNVSARARSSWWSLISGFAMAIPITLQCWRMYCDTRPLADAPTGSESASTGQSTSGTASGSTAFSGITSSQILFPQKALCPWNSEDLYLPEEVQLEEISAKNNIEIFHGDILNPKPHRPLQSLRRGTNQPMI